MPKISLITFVSQISLDITLYHLLMCSLQELQVELIEFLQLERSGINRKTTELGSVNGIRTIYIAQTMFSTYRITSTGHTMILNYPNILFIKNNVMIKKNKRNLSTVTYGADNKTGN